MTNAEILFASISEVGTLYRSASVSPVEVTLWTLERIEQLDPRLKAFITVTAESAMAAARKAERELHKSNDRGPLHGIPVAVKDLIDIEGIRTTAGSRILSDNMPSRDAHIVQRLRCAGAVIVGKTNMQEFAYGVPHSDYDQTRNPWNLSHTAGGSSGGSAAAVVAGMCYAAIGTDTGGSIRVPSAYCGAAGLKPTYGLVSLDGVFPLSWSLDHAGPMARRSEDVGNLLAVIANRPSVTGSQLDLKELRLGILTEHLEGSEMQLDVRGAFDHACELLSQEGVAIQPVSIPDLSLADAGLLSVVGPEASTIHARWIKECPEDYSPGTRGQIELGFAVPAVTYVRMQQFRRHLVAQFLTVLDRVDAILSPTVPWVAPEKDPIIFGDQGVAEGRRTVPYNLTGLPAHTVFCGFSSVGLPIGLQIAARPGADALALGIGTAFEAILWAADRVPSFADRHETNSGDLGTEQA
jgi:aspartyl-tRNA(Asn)/glutamyl-tRNA(Gln) amidotransferase subunit A